MAQQIQIAGAGTTAKVRSPVAVAIFAVITLGIYLVFWWYFINREMADYGRALGTNELGDSPGKSTLALFPGALLIVPAIWTTVTTFKRVQAAQRLSNQTSINGWLGLVLYVVISPAMYAYMQSGLNGVWKTQAVDASGAAGSRLGIEDRRAAADPRRGALEPFLVEEVRDTVRDLVHGTVELVRPRRGVDGVADGDLVAHDEDSLLGAREEVLVCEGVTPCGVVEALATRKGVGARVCSLPRPVVLDRPAFEVADVDVVQKRLDLERHVPSCQRELGRLARATEARVNAEIERDPGELGSEAGRLRFALRGQFHRHVRIAVHMVRDVQLRLTVTRENEELHPVSLRLP